MKQFISIFVMGVVAFTGCRSGTSAETQLSTTRKNPAVEAPPTMICTLRDSTGELGNVDAQYLHGVEPIQETTINQHKVYAVLLDDAAIGPLPPRANKKKPKVYSVALGLNGAESFAKDVPPGGSFSIKRKNVLLSCDVQVIVALPGNAQ